jgi:flavin reductase (DIM6/NTAB) family NADH-FMN oxidoreductase RutF
MLGSAAASRCCQPEGDRVIAMMPAMDHQELRNAYACFPSGVAALCAVVEGYPVGMAASSFTSASLDPPLVSVCVNRTSTTWPKLESSPRLGVSFLGAAHDVTCRQLAAKTGDRFDGIRWEASAAGAVFIEGASVWLECLLYRQFEAGDHVIALLRIEGLKINPHVSPLVFHASQFKQLADS